MQQAISYNYELFMLANRSFCFHPGGALSSLGLLASIPPSLDKSKTVILDYGCGNGLTLTTLAKLGFTNLIGFDTSKEMIMQNQKADLFNIRFFSNYEEMMGQTGRADVLLMESVFSYIDADKEAFFIDTVNQLVERLNIQYTAIIDLYRFSPKDEKFNQLISSIFGVKKLRDKAGLFSALSNIRAKESKIVQEKLYAADNNFSFDVNSMVSNIIAMYPKSRADKAGLQNYFLNHAGDMQRAFRLFKNNFKYVSVLLQH